jgi:hypothetical protein
MIGATPVFRRQFALHRQLFILFILMIGGDNMELAVSGGCTV